jgi:hypothetical protein
MEFGDQTRAIDQGSSDPVLTDLEKASSPKANVGLPNDAYQA